MPVLLTVDLCVRQTGTETKEQRQVMNNYDECIVVTVYRCIVR